MYLGNYKVWYRVGTGKIQQRKAQTNEAHAKPEPAIEEIAKSLAHAHDVKPAAIKIIRLVGGGLNWEMPNAAKQLEPQKEDPRFDEIRKMARRELIEFVMNEPKLKHLNTDMPKGELVNAVLAALTEAKKQTEAAAV